MGCLPRIITLVILLLSIYGHAEGNARGTNAEGNGKGKDKKRTDEDAAELEEVNRIMSIRFNAGKLGDVDKLITETAKEMFKAENPGAEIDETSEKFLFVKERVRIHHETATGPNYASLFTRPGTAEKFKDMFDKYDHIREYKSEL